MSKRWPCSGLVFLRVAGHEQPTSCHKSFAASSLGVLIASQGSMAVAAPRWLACRPSTNKVPSSLRPGMQSSTAIQESKMKAEHTLSPPNCVKGQPRWPSKCWADWIHEGSTNACSPCGGLTRNFNTKCIVSRMVTHTSESPESRQMEQVQPGQPQSPVPIHWPNPPHQGKRYRQRMKPWLVQRCPDL